MNIKEQIAKDLLSIGAVFLRPEDPFTWASGIKSPIYCDNRLTLTSVEVRNHVENALAETIKREYPDAEVLMGTSTAGIAHAAITAHLLDLPMGYVRSGAKDHGRHNQIEGRLEKGQKVVVVEDLISTAGSCIEVVNVLREAGAWRQCDWLLRCKQQLRLQGRKRFRYGACGWLLCRYHCHAPSQRGRTYDCIHALSGAYHQCRGRRT